MKLPQTSKTDNILIAGLVLSYAGIAIQFGSGYGLIAVGIALTLMALAAKLSGEE